MTAMEAVSYLLFVSYLFSFFALTIVASKAAGKSVWLFTRGPTQTLPATLFRLAFAGAAIWPVLLALGLDPFPSDPIRAALDGLVGDIIGHLLIAIGACVAVLAQQHMGASWRIGAAEGEQGKIVDTGPFALSRNPVFVGQVLLFVGLFLVLPGIVQGVLTVAILIAVRLQVGIEEKVLSATLGKPYLDYLMRVRRWIGTVPQSTPVQTQNANSGRTS
jgi:protein-S-isoprenylcysteine O-methyltransferase Ste14